MAISRVTMADCTLNSRGHSGVDSFAVGGCSATRADRGTMVNNEKRRTMNGSIFFLFSKLIAIF